MGKTKERFMEIVQAGFDPDYDYSDDEYFQEQDDDYAVPICRYG